MLDAYDFARLSGFAGSLHDFYKKTYEDKGFDGLIAVGYEGNEEDAKATLQSVDDEYEIALSNGYEGTEAEWLRIVKSEKESRAYEFAASKGFAGSFAEWIEGLKELEGEMGPMPNHSWDGCELSFERPDGTFSTPVRLVGPEGKNGLDGKDGKAGKDGKDGKNGKNGLDGKDGKDGKDGADGEDGKDGDIPRHEIDGNRIRFELPDGFGEWINLESARQSSGGGSISIHKFYSSFQEFPSQGKSQVLYFDKSVTPFAAYVWHGSEYEPVGGGESTPSAKVFTWTDYVTRAKYIETVSGQLIYTFQGDTIYRFVPSPYEYEQDAFFADEDQNQLLAARI